MSAQPAGKKNEIVVPQGDALAPYKHLVELQAQIIAATRKNAEIKERCSTLRNELPPGKKPGSVLARAKRKLKTNGKKLILSAWLTSLKSHFVATP